MITTLQHRQTRVLSEPFRLPVLVGEIISPYVRDTGMVNRLTNIIMVSKAVVFNFDSFTSLRVTASYLDSSNNVVENHGMDYDATGCVTAQDFQVAANAAVAAYAVSQGYTLTDGIIWLTTVNPASRVVSSQSLSIQTSTGAVGTQLSSTRDAFFFGSLSESVTATIAGSAVLDILLEVAPTNSSTVGDWVERGRVGNSSAVSLAVALQVVDKVTGMVGIFVPAGYYIKARSANASGTNTGTFIVGHKVLL